MGDGLVDRVELFEPEDQAGMRTRVTELRAGRTGALAEMRERYVGLVAARDWDGLRAFYADFAPAQAEAIRRAMRILTETETETEEGR